MKHALTYFLFLSFISAGYSQDVYDKMANESCSCIKAKKIDFTKNTDVKDMQINAGLCIIDSYTSHKSEISESDKLQFSGLDGMRKLGEKVAMKMMPFCPEVIMAMGKKYLDEKDAKEKIVIEEPPLIITPVIHCIVTAIETKQFITLKVKDKESRIHNLLFLNPFSTASLLTENEIKIGDTLTVGYSEKEMYDPVTKDFKYFKIITSLKKE